MSNHIRIIDSCLRRVTDSGRYEVCSHPERSGRLWILEDEPLPFSRVESWPKVTNASNAIWMCFPAP